MEWSPIAARTEFDKHPYLLISYCSLNYFSCEEVVLNGN
jgi:hypothetical protein